MTRDIALRRKENARKAGVLLAGGVIGALAGIGAAYLLLAAREARREETGAELPVLSSSSAVKLGVLLFGLFRQIDEIARGR
jgi:ABC-type antimicrobial peptide transport system permease subunit